MMMAGTNPISSWARGFARALNALGFLLCLAALQAAELTREGVLAEGGNAGGAMRGLRNGLYGRGERGIRLWSVLR